MVRTFVFGLFLLASTAQAFVVVAPTRTITPLYAATSKEAGYTPKWKKKETIGGEGLDDAAKGLIGNVPVVFVQGNATKTTMAIVGQPLSDVATQAGQFIKYSCKKGECGTCECMMDGKWVRPCIATVPAGVEEVRISVNAIQSATTSSGKFYSIKSFFMGFYNNLLGMVGFVKTRREAKKNWTDRIEYEDLIAQKTEEKRLARLAAEQASLKP
jgi:MinD-like ATPase involved in chromosome partitioning or flagellar assembly